MIYKEFEKLVMDVPYSRDKLKEYRIELNKIDKVFRRALALEYGASDNPKEHLLWDISWEMGHSSGYAEVEGYYMRLLDLIT